MVSIELIGNREPLSPNQMEGKGRLLLGKLNLNLIHLPVGKSDKAGRTAAKARVHQELLKLLFLALIERADGAVIILMELIALHRYPVCLCNPQDTGNISTPPTEKNSSRPARPISRSRTAIPFWMRCFMQISPFGITISYDYR